MKGLLVLFMLKKITRNRSQLKRLRAKPASRLSQQAAVKTSQPAIACSKLTIETLKEGVKYVQS